MVFTSRLSRESAFFFFFFNDTATTEIYTLSLHDALPISLATESGTCGSAPLIASASRRSCSGFTYENRRFRARSEEHTSELQSLAYLVCRLLLEKKKYADKQRAGRVTAAQASPCHSPQSI